MVGTNHEAVVDDRGNQLGDMNGSSQQRTLSERQVGQYAGRLQFRFGRQGRPGGLDPFRQQDRPVKTECNRLFIKCLSPRHLHKLNEIRITGLREPARHIQDAMSQAVGTAEGKGTNRKAAAAGKRLRYGNTFTECRRHRNDFEHRAAVVITQSSI